MTALSIPAGVWEKDNCWGRLPDLGTGMALLAYLLAVACVCVCVCAFE